MGGVVSSVSGSWSERAGVGPTVEVALMEGSEGLGAMEGTFEVAAETEQWMMRLMRGSSRSSRISFSNQVRVSGACISYSWAFWTC